MSQLLRRLTPGTIPVENVTTGRKKWYTRHELDIMGKASTHGQDTLTQVELQTLRDLGSGIVGSFPISRKGDDTRQSRYDTLSQVAHIFSCYEDELVRLQNNWDETVGISLKSAKKPANLRGAVCIKELKQALTLDEAQSIVAETKTTLQEVRYVSKKVARAAHFLSGVPNMAANALCVVLGSFTAYISMRLGFQGPEGAAPDYLIKLTDLIGLHDTTNFTGLKYALGGTAAAWVLKKTLIWNATRNAYNLANQYYSEKTRDHVITILKHTPGTPAYEEDSGTRQITTRSPSATIDLKERALAFWDKFWNPNQ